MSKPATSRRIKPSQGMIESKSLGSILANIGLIVILSIVAICCVVPLWHCLMSSISDGETLFRTEGLVLLPVGGATLDGYKLTLRDSSVLRPI